MMADGHGGRRPGAGRPAGSRNRSTMAREAGAVTLAELARESTADAIMALREVMLDAEAPASARISAATALLDRAYGRPSPRVALDNDPDSADADTLRLIGPDDPGFEPLEPEPLDPEPGTEDAA